MLRGQFLAKKLLQDVNEKDDICNKENTTNADNEGDIFSKETTIGC